LTAESQQVENRITVDSKIITGTIEPIWNGVGGSTGLALTPQGERLLHRIRNTSEYPFYKRIWGITSTGTAVPFTAEADWGSTNVYQADKNGNPYYDFTLFDQILDVIVKENFIPIMHLGLMPDSLSSAPDSVPHTKDNLVRYPPEDYSKWHDLIYHIVTHCKERYGKGKVMKWKWEMWNEPDIINY
jgi:xylan 1,4-beta-xylosidase